LLNERTEGNVLAFPIIVYVLASWLIAAHFLRADDLALAALCLAAPGLFFVHERWSVLLLQCLPTLRAQSGCSLHGKSSASVWPLINLGG
jgi:hypothetical protein